MAIAAVFISLVSAGPAVSERIQQGNVLASLNGGFSPLKLPRQRSAPVSLSLSGKLTTTDGSALPRVNTMRFALPGRSGLQAGSFPVCPAARLRNTRDREALAACGDALVGHGHLDVQARIPSQGPLPVKAHLLIFNGRTRTGRVALLMHAYAESPPVSIVIPFVLRHPKGEFGSELVAHDLASKPTISGFSMTISGRLPGGGPHNSYLVGSCPLPPRLTSGLLNVALLKYDLEGDRHISIGIVRTCRARD